MTKPKEQPIGTHTANPNSDYQREEIASMLMAALSMTTKGRQVHDVSVKYEGAEITLPVINGRPMSFDEGIKWLERKKVEEEQTVAVNYSIPCSPMDGAYAFHRALSKKYGWTHQIPTPGFFGDTPPAMLGIKISAKETVNVPWGRIQIPGITGFLTTGLTVHPKPAFIIGGEVRKKHAEDVKEIVELTKKLLIEESIYKGKAVKISFNFEREERNYDPRVDCPQFMDVTGVREEDLIFGEKVMGDLKIGLFTPIEQSDACRRFKIPLKRGLLLHGVYGTGKTMTATVTALKAERAGWTFVYLDNVLDLKKGLEFAAQYAPAVIFAEDIDRAITGNRSTSMDEVLNTLDGIDTKGGEIITVFTTNHIENINPAMLRMGRLDTLVEVLPPDAHAAQRLVKLYARDLLHGDVSLENLGKTLQGRIPAYIREVVERGKIAAIGRTNGGDIKGLVVEEDLLAAAHAMETHAKMLEPKKSDGKPQPMLTLHIPANHEDVHDVVERFGYSKDLMNGHAAAEEAA